MTTPGIRKENRPRVRTEDTGRLDSLGRRIRRKPVTAAANNVNGHTSDIYGDLPHDNDYSSEYELIDHEVTAEYDGDFESLIALSEEKLQERKELADEIVESGEPHEALELITEILADDTYDELRSAQAAHKKIFDSRNSKFQRLGRELDKAVGEGKEYAKADDIYEVAQEALAEADKHDLAKMLADENLNVAAKLAHHLEQVDGYDTISSWQGESLGPEGIVPGGEFETGSREWLEFRQGGFGGSDIAGTNAHDRYRFNNVRDIWDSKVLPISESQVRQQEKGQEVFDDPMSRGNAFENFVGHLYGVKNPDVQLLHNKSTWVKEGSDARINYDILTCDDGTGVPNGCLEIKTASKAENWGPEGGGIDDVPEGYGIQLLSQMRMAGFSKGAIAVLIDGNDHRTYHVEMTPELAKKADEYMNNTQDMYDNAKLARAGKPHTQPDEVAWKSSTDFSATIKKTTDVDANKMVHFRELSLIQGQEISDVVKDYEKRISQNGGDANAAMKSMYQDIKPTDTSKFIGIDIETTGLSPTKSRIIEMGITGDNKVNELYSMDDLHQRIYGTGAEEVHNISVKDIQGKPRISDPEVTSDLLDKLTSGPPIVAHNARFEKTFLRAHLKGFTNAESEGKIHFIDTKNVAKYGMPHLDRNRLQDFVEDAGMEYANAHRAYVDAEMMMDAFKIYENRRK